jgi:hypothetical protein
MEKISWTDRVKYEVLHSVKEKRSILHEVIRRKVNWMVTSGIRTAFYKTLLKEG